MQIQPNEPSHVNNESIISSIQLETPMKAFKKLYFFLIVLGAVALAFGGPVGIIFGIVIGWAVAYIVMQAVSGFKLMKLNFKDYPLYHPIADEQLYEILSSVSLHPDFKVEKGVRGVRFIFKNITAHRIHINQKEQTYSIISKLTNKSLIKKRHNPGVVEYSYSFTAVPFIKQTVEEVTATLSQNNSSLSDETK
ncbi:hypothetical protein J2T12_000136 [Paenibacillus anaericanus]|uniref:hypothetical protein n=1 Tax=Paenibacillus anaericanus TaxID=170367 RepID=UPI00278B31E7|nr:hypothetical protein [Paenibacillus anaericanus]MDQ0086742.1 hypothetical protein [Paenibacillus anaericanus]